MAVIFSPVDDELTKTKEEHHGLGIFYFQLYSQS